MRHPLFDIANDPEVIIIKNGFPIYLIIIVLIVIALTTILIFRAHKKREKARRETNTGNSFPDYIPK